MAESKKRRKHRRILSLRLIILLVILCTAAFLFTADPLFNLDFGLIRTTKTTESLSLIIEIRDVFTLNTIEFIHKTVFPYDFIPKEIDWGKLLRKRKEGILLSGKEPEYLEVYDLCRELDIPIGRGNYNFVIIESTVKAGFDLKNTVYENPEEYQDQIAETLRPTEDGEIEIRLPEPVITDFIIEDSSSSTYNYPDITIDPEGWKTLTGYISGRVEEIVRNNGILEMAGEKGKVFIEKMLQDSGFKAVIFL